MALLSLLPAQQGGVSPLPGRQQWWPGNRLWATAAQWPRGKQVDGEGQEARVRGELGRGSSVGGGGWGCGWSRGIVRTAPTWALHLRWVIHDPSEDLTPMPGPQDLTL